MGLELEVIDRVVIETIFASPVALGRPWVSMPSGPLNQVEWRSTFEGERHEGCAHAVRSKALDSGGTQPTFDDGVNRPVRERAIARDVAALADFYKEWVIAGQLNTDFLGRHEPYLDQARHVRWDLDGSDDVAFAGNAQNVVTQRHADARYAEARQLRPADTGPHQQRNDSEVPLGEESMRRSPQVASDGIQDVASLPARQCAAVAIVAAPYAPEACSGVVEKQAAPPRLREHASDDNESPVRRGPGVPRCQPLSVLVELRSGYGIPRLSCCREPPEECREISPVGATRLGRVTAPNDRGREGIERIGAVGRDSRRPARQSRVTVQRPRADALSDGAAPRPVRRAGSRET